MPLTTPPLPFQPSHSLTPSLNHIQSVPPVNMDLDSPFLVNVPIQQNVTGRILAKKFIRNKKRVIQPSRPGSTLSRVSKRKLREADSISQQDKKQRVTNLRHIFSDDPTAETGEAQPR